MYFRDWWSWKCYKCWCINYFKTFAIVAACVWTAHSILYGIFYQIVPSSGCVITPVLHGLLSIFGASFSLSKCSTSRKYCASSIGSIINSHDFCMRHFILYCFCHHLQFIVFIPLKRTFIHILSIGWSIQLQHQRQI